MALASVGDINLVVLSRMDDWRPERGHLEQSDLRRHRQGAKSGMINIPDPAAGPARLLAHPVSDTIEDTEPIDTPGSLIVQQATKLQKTHWL
jgi:hypothetical protein